MKVLPDINSMWRVVFAVLAISMVMAIGSVSAQCAVKDGVTKASWHSSETWDGCTGASGLPGPSDEVIIQGALVITIEENSAPVSVAGLGIYNRALLVNHGSLNTSNLEISGSELLSEGSLGLSGDGAVSLAMEHSHLVHVGDLKISDGAQVQLMTQQSTIEVEGSINVESSEAGQVQVLIQQSTVKIGDGFSVLGGNVSFLLGDMAMGPPFARAEAESWSKKQLIPYISSASLEVKNGDLSIRTRDASNLNSTGNIQFMNYFGRITVKRGDLVVQTGDAKHDGTTGGVSLTLYASSWEIFGNMHMETGSVENSLSTTGSIAAELYEADWAILSRQGVEDSGTLTIRGGSGGNPASASMTGIIMKRGFLPTLSALQVLVVTQGGALYVDKDLIITGGDGGHSVGAPGGNGSSILFSNPSVTRIGRNVLITGGNGGDSSDGQGGIGGATIFGSAILSTSTTLGIGDMNVGGNVQLNNGNGGKGVNGGDADNGLFFLIGQVAGDVVINSGNAGSSIGGGSGGSCVAPLSGLATRGVESLFSVSVYTVGKASVGGDVKVTGCNGGDGLGGNGGDAVGVGFGSVMGNTKIGGSVKMIAGKGGDAVNSTAYSSATPLTSGSSAGATVYLLAGKIEIDGDFEVEISEGADVVGGSGTTGIQTGLIMQSILANTLIGGSFRLTGAPAGSVLAGSVTDSQGQVQFSCGASIYLQAGSFNIQGDLSLQGCDAGKVITQIPTAPAKRSSVNQKKAFSNFINDAKRFESASLSGGNAAPRQTLPIIEPDNSISLYLAGARLVINGEANLVAGRGADANVNDGTAGGHAGFAVSDSSDVKFESSVSIVGGRGGNSEQGFGGNAGVAAVEISLASLLSTADLSLQGGAAGRGANSSMDGNKGIVVLATKESSQYAQYGALSAVEGSSRSGESVVPPDFAEYSNSTLLVDDVSQWTIYPCSKGGITFTTTQADAFRVTGRSTFRDCRGGGVTSTNYAVKADADSDASCLGCTCSEEALVGDDCGSGAALKSALVHLFHLVLSLF